MGNKQFPNAPDARTTASQRRKNTEFQIRDGRIDVRTSLALDGQTANARSLETQCWRGFQGFDENLTRARTPLRTTSTVNFACSFATRFLTSSDAKTGTERPAKYFSFQTSSRPITEAKRSMSAFVLVSVAQTRSASPSSGKSSPSATPATIFSCARCSTTSLAGFGSVSATS